MPSMAALASWRFKVFLGSGFKVSLVPDLWTARFGQGTAWRWGIGLLGGVLLGFGARMADGCTSGHTLSGAAQLALSGWVATAGFFIGGIAMALLVYGRRSY